MAVCCIIYCLDSLKTNMLMSFRLSHPDNQSHVTGVYYSGKECHCIWLLIRESEFSIGGPNMSSLFSILVMSIYLIIIYHFVSFFSQEIGSLLLPPVILKLMWIYTHGKGIILFVCKLYWHTWSQYRQSGLKCLVILVLVLDHRPWG